jgi:hypothetical protein
MTGFIEVHPRNAFQGLLLVNVNDIKHIYQIQGSGKEKTTVLRLQGAETKPIDIEESYEDVKRLIALALEGPAVNVGNLRMVHPHNPRSSFRGTH